jgi:photosystem II stability/assembly factor-like uncharacterized protein
VKLLKQKQKNQTEGRTKKTVALAVAVVVLVVVGVGAFIALNRGGPAVYTPVERFSHIHGLAVDPKDSKVLYVATHHGLIRGLESAGRWSWALVGNYRADFMGFSMHPNGKIFYSSGHKAPETPNIGVARSDDGGFSWKIIALRGKVDFHAMAISGANPEVLYGWYYGERRLYRSADGGQTWGNPKAEGLSDVFALAAEPADAQALWAATKRGLLRSTDGGESFELVSFSGIPVIAVTVAPTTPQVLYISLEGGLRKSTDGGQNWGTMGQEIAGAVGHIAIDHTNADTVYAATHSAALYQSTDGSRSWRRIKEGE